MKNIVFFDGICNLCNGFVDFLIKRDKKNLLQFASLQGETAKEYLRDIDPMEMESVVFYRNGEIFTRSTASIEILRTIGGVWKAAVILKIFPGNIRDFVYNFIARKRYKWFGKRDTCRVPTEREKGKMLP